MTLYNIIMLQTIFEMSLMWQIMEACKMIFNYSDYS